jgi:hypothetical protein
MERLTSSSAVSEAARHLKRLVQAHGEWFYVAGEGATSPLALRRSEIDLTVSHDRLIFSCWTEKGTRSWRVRAWEWTGAKLLLEATRRAGAESALIELIPRVSTKTINANVSTARRLRAVELARVVCESSSGEGATIERVGLSAGARRNQPGRAARILLLRRRRERICATGVVTPAEAYEVDAFLSSALVWFIRAAEKSVSTSIYRLWLITDRKHREALAAHLALLRDELRRVISVYEIDDEWTSLKPVSCPALAELWSGRRERFRRPVRSAQSEWATRIMALAPDEIDVIRARHGETLRFQGLPFARVRRVMNAERVWFGVAGARARLLDESNASELDNLLQRLREHRRADAVDRRHAFYRAAPEAWLESLLRRNITRLDPGLRLAPLYAQFRASQSSGAGGTHSRPVDLLALRRDGRLVVIELKVRADREHVLQAADYWRRVETHRRWGNLARARLFGDARIADEPPLVYLVAPTLSFHRNFKLLAHAITPAIELYRFDLNEDWRAGVRVTLRETLTR